MKKIFLAFWHWITRKDRRVSLTEEEFFQEIYGKKWRDIVYDNKR
jgi:hypothetical protein